MGLLDDSEKAARFQAAINASKDSTGKPNPYVAAGIVMDMGRGYSLGDAAMLGGMPGAQGAFDDEEGL